jgi:cellulose synthase/poly-beta-1,6-N-acetylglucosamine synthase-like glycosyltransferase
MGTGMAMPWALADVAVIATGSLAEDLSLGAELARRRKPALFLPTAKVVSTFPATEAGRTNQRNRWVSGHLQLILVRLPSLLLEAVRNTNKPLLALALDLAVPPLTLFVLLHTLSLVAAALFIYISPLPVAIELASLIVFMSAVISCWKAQGRDLFGPMALLSLARYAIFRSHFYFKMLRHGLPNRWERADRQKK